MKFFFALLFCSFSLFGEVLDLEPFIDERIVLSTKQIPLEKYPGAHNPSLYEWGDGYIMTFRYAPNPYYDPWVNYIGAVLLNENFDQVSEPELLDVRFENPLQSQAEDARIFSYRGCLYVIYNDNTEIHRPWYRERRDMYVSELSFDGNHFSLARPVKLYYGEKYFAQFWQKNWTPFEWNNKILIAYSIHPHEIVYANLHNGECYNCYTTSSKFQWPWGTLRGSSPAIVLDGEYFSFFHSGHYLKSSVSSTHDRWHYFMGAYTFSKDPPFELKKISPKPLAGPGFYVDSYQEKRVILPGGFVVKGPLIYLSYGKDDSEVWIATLDKKALLESLKPVEND